MKIITDYKQTHLALIQEYPGSQLSILEKNDHELLFPFQS